jgi:hypothetical protein
MFESIFSCSCVPEEPRCICLNAALRRPHSLMAARQLPTAVELGGGLTRLRLHFNGAIQPPELSGWRGDRATCFIIVHVRKQASF